MAYLLRVGPACDPGAAGDDGSARRLARGALQPQPAVERAAQPARAQLQPSS